MTIAHEARIEIRTLSVMPEQARAIIALWLRRARTRRQLWTLEASRLADIGIDEDARRREAAKWFWQK